MPDRYDTSGNPEAQYQPGSHNLVLVNMLGITDVNEMEQAEFDSLVQLQDALFQELEFDQKIDSDDLSEWHRRWLALLSQLGSKIKYFRGAPPPN